jgi:hypothetical protein
VVVVNAFKLRVLAESVIQMHRAAAGNGKNMLYILLCQPISDIIRHSYFHFDTFAQPPNICKGTDVNFVV